MPAFGFFYSTQNIQHPGSKGHCCGLRKHSASSIKKKKKKSRY